ALHLEPQILRVELRHHVTAADAIADIDDALDDLAGDPEAEVGLVACAHDADEVARRAVTAEVHALDLHQTFRPGDGRDGSVLAGGKQGCEGQDGDDVEPERAHGQHSSAACDD